MIKHYRSLSITDH